MDRHYDCIVLGVGGFGSAALYHLARRGLRVLGLEQYGIAHDRGSSHGETRIIRKAYFEHPDYVPLLQRAYTLWQKLEREEWSGRLLNRVGLFLAGPPDSEAVAGTRQAAEAYHLPLEIFSDREAASRFPGFRFTPGSQVVFERDAGYLSVEDCVRAHISAAIRRGADFRTNARVVSWKATGGTVQVQTEQETFTADRLVITAGPWAGTLLADLGLPLTVVRKPQFWFPAADGEYDVAAGCPAFLFEMEAGQFYGFPRLDGRLLKVAEHSGGKAVVDPVSVEREIQPDDLPRIADFLQQHLPGISTVPATHSVCMYTRTPDGHFLVDQHPEYPQVVFGAGFSGHGFKFTSVLGEVLADLAVDGRTEQPIGFLSLCRRRTAVDAKRASGGG
jgi:sarcosine oxidase